MSHFIAIIINCLFFNLFLFQFVVANQVKSNKPHTDKENTDYNEYYVETEENVWSNNVGSVLFGEVNRDKKCFSQEEIALLASRKQFNAIIPFKKNKIIESDRCIEVLMEYFYGVNEIIHKMTCSNSKHLTLSTFFDVVGGYLHHRLIPATKLSFYAGELTLKSVNTVFNLYKHCVKYLNTNGNGWSQPITNFTEFEYKIVPIKFMNVENDQTPCVNLMLLDDRTDSENDVIIALPKIETEDNMDISNMWLPYKRKHIFNLEAMSSAFIMLRYYIDVSKCYKFQGIPQDTFDQKLYIWIRDNVLHHLFGTKFYPAFGAVLRILETVRPGARLTQNLPYLGKAKTPCAVNGKTGEDEINELQNAINKVTHDTESANFFDLFISHDADPKKRKIAQTAVAMVFLTTIIGVIIFIYLFTKNRRAKKCSKPPSIDQIEIAPDSAAINGGTATSGSELMRSQTQKTSAAPLRRNDNNAPDPRFSIDESDLSPARLRLSSEKQDIPSTPSASEKRSSIFRRSKIKEKK